MTECPPRDRLWQLVCGSSTCPDFRAIEAHVEECERCQEFLEAVRTGKSDPGADASGDDVLPTLPGVELLERLGKGGMGVVFKARQRHLGRFVAVKLLLGGGYAESGERARFRREAEAVARLQHPNVVQILDVGEAGGRPFLVLEYAEGRSLAERQKEMPLPEKTASQMIETLARAVDYIHSHQIIHRDLKPANILLFGPLDAPVERQRLKISDFGLAKQFGTQTSSESGTVLGTPSYMAPEQADSKAVDSRTDVYALGAILYQMFTGRPPFQASSPLETLEQVRIQDPVPPRNLQPGISRDLETICLKCLRKDPPKRYATAVALADDLRRFLDGRPIVARPVSTMEHAWRWCQRKPAIAILSAALLLTVAIGLSFALVLGRRAMINEARALNGEAKALANLEQEEIARRETEEHYSRLRGMVGNVIHPHGTSFVWELGAKPWRAQMMNEADSCLSFLVQRRDQDPELRELLAPVLVQLGAIRVAQNQDAEAQMFFERAARLWERSPAGESHKPEDRAWRAITYAYLVQIHERQGRIDLARQSFGSTFRTWPELVEGPPGLHSTYFLENALLDLGWVVIDGGFPEKGAARRLEKVRDHLQRLGGGSKYDLFFDLVRVGYLRAETQKFESARQKAAVLTAAREAASILNRLLGRTDLHRNTRCHMACMAFHVSMFLRRGEALDEALRLSERANRTLRDLLHETPGEYYLLNALYRSWQEIAKVRWDLDQTEEALTACRKALEAQRQAFTLSPAMPEAREVLGWCYVQLGRKLCELGRLDEAEACFRERQALWPGDEAKHAEVQQDLRRWAAKVGNDKNNLSPEQRQERQHYRQLCARLERKPVGALPVAGSAKP